jgi:hypothetical protein
LATLESAVAAQFSEWGYVPFPIVEIFGGDSPQNVAAALDEFCVRELGSPVEAVDFFRVSIGSVHGLRLADGRRVVVKAMRPGTRLERLESIQNVQRALVAEGFPCPSPVGGPATLARGSAIVESQLETGEPGDAHDPAVRRVMTRTLANLVQRCRSFVSDDSLRGGPQAGLWPPPHEGRFDFDGTANGAEWIDEIAADARRILDGSDGGLVVGHGDWRAENMRFAGGEISAVYDWDSLAIAREPALVGGAAHQFTSDYSRADHRQLPTLDESLSFIDEYEAARGKSFTADERRLARASLTYAMAYSSRCEHSDLLTDFGSRAPRTTETLEAMPGTARAFLAAHASELLDSV